MRLNVIDFDRDLISRAIGLQHILLSHDNILGSRVAH